MVRDYDRDLERDREGVLDIIEVEAWVADLACLCILTGWELAWELACDAMAKA